VALTITPLGTEFLIAKDWGETESVQNVFHPGPVCDLGLVLNSRLVPTSLAFSFMGQQPLWPIFA
jgi:hypothetical protein